MTAGVLATSCKDVPGLRIRPQPGLTTSGYQIFLNGVRCTGVTSATSIIEKPALVHWAAEEAVKYLKQTWTPGVAFDQATRDALLMSAENAHTMKARAGKDLGGQAAEWMEAYISGMKPAEPTEPKLKAVTEQFRDWELDHKVTWLASEWSVADPETYIGARLDAFAVIDKRPGVADLKAVNGGWVYPEMELQVSTGHHIVTNPKAGVLEGVKPEDVARWLLVINKPKDGVGPITFGATVRGQKPKADAYEVRTNVTEDWLAVCAAARLRQRIPREWK